MTEESTTTEAAARRYTITLDAIEPAGLPFGQGVKITVAARPYGGGWGAISVELEATDPDLLLQLIRANWGSEDETGCDWRSEITEVPA